MNLTNSACASSGHEAARSIRAARLFIFDIGESHHAHRWRYTRASSASPGFARGGAGCLVKAISRPGYQSFMIAAMAGGLGLPAQIHAQHDYPSRIVQIVN